MAGAGQASDRNTFGRPCVEHRRTKMSIRLRRRKIIIFSGSGEEPVVGGDTFSPLAPILGPEKKEWPYHPLLLFVGVNMVPNM